MFSTENSILFWCGISLIPTLVYSIIQITFYSGLKANFPKQWQHAGSPTIWADGSWVASGHVIEYLKQAKYQESNDMLGMEYCKNNRKAMIYTYYLSIYSCCVFFGLLLIAACW